MSSAAQQTADGTVILSFVSVENLFCVLKGYGKMLSLDNKLKVKIQIKSFLFCVCISKIIYGLSPNSSKDTPVCAW